MFAGPGALSPAPPVPVTLTSREISELVVGVSVQSQADKKKEKNQMCAAHSGDGVFVRVLQAGL